MDLYGWDTAYATDFAILNNALAGDASLPSKFASTQSGITASGVLENWRLVPGGSGPLLHIQVALTSGNISGGTDPAADLAGVSLIFEVNLTLLPTAVKGVKVYRLDLKTVGKKGDPPKPGVVLPYSISDPNGKLGFEQKIALPAMIAGVLVQQADDFTVAFARVNLVAPATNSWLTPVKVRYDVYAGSGKDYLVIYAATSARNVDGLDTNVDPALLAGAGPMYYGISGNLFLEHAVLPLMPKLFNHSKAADFKFNASKSAIVNTTSFAAGKVKSGAIWYHPEITKVSLRISGDEIVTDVSGTCDLGMGITMTFSIQSKSKSSFDPKTGRLSFAKDKHPTENHHAKIPWYDYVLGPIPDIVMAVVVPMVASGIANGITAELSKETIGKEGAQNVKWPGMNGFSINAGGLNGGIQLSGNNSN